MIPSERIEVEGLEEVIDELRSDVPVRDDWRTALLQEIARTAAPSRARVERRMWKPWPTAIAAGILGLLTGAGGMALLRSGDVSTPATSPNPVSATPIANHQVTDMAVRFAVLAPGVTRVSVVGDFNGWNPNATPMQLAADGRTWSAMLPLAQGRHAYAFVIDGEVVADPSAPRSADDDFGKPNSLILVSNAP